MSYYYGPPAWINAMVWQLGEVLEIDFDLHTRRAVKRLQGDFASTIRRDALRRVEEKEDLRRRGVIV